MHDFPALFGRQPLICSQAPGRVNLMGEHTDYNGGFVLPTPISQRTTVQLASREDRTVRAWSANVAGGPLDYMLGKEQAGRGWLDFIQGATVILRQEGMDVRGFDVRVESEVPLGSGLSSSASLGVSLMRALREAFGLPLEDRQIALLAQRVENRFVGAMVGIMDPMACSLGQPGTALFLDTRSLVSERVPLPPGVDWIVINSGVAHEHSAGDYNSRRAECEEACRLLGVKQLRDLSTGDLPRVATLPQPFCRRARHVVTEDARVLASVDAMRAGDSAALGKLFNASHDSQRDDYQVSVPAVDLLIELAREQSDVYGARLTGGGFGGSIVLFTAAGKGDTATRSIAATYAAKSGHQPTVLQFGQAAGAR
jgi:galactokinase